VKKKGEKKKERVRTARPATVSSSRSAPAKKKKGEKGRNVRQTDLIRSSYQLLHRAVVPRAKSRRKKRGEKREKKRSRPSPYRFSQFLQPGHIAFREGKKREKNTKKRKRGNGAHPIILILRSCRRVGEERKRRKGWSRAASLLLLLAGGA